MTILTDGNSCFNLHKFPERFFENNLIFYKVWQRNFFIMTAVNYLFYQEKCDIEAQFQRSFAQTEWRFAPIVKMLRSHNLLPSHPFSVFSNKFRAGDIGRSFLDPF